MPFHIHSHWLLQRASICAALGVLSLGAAQWAHAKVAVLANRTPTTITITALPTGQPARTVPLGPGDSRPVYFDRQLRIRYDAQARNPAAGNSRARADRTSRLPLEGTPAQKQWLQAASAYYFGLSSEGTLVFEKIGLGGNSTHQTDPEPSTEESRRFVPAGDDASTIPVKILVDDDEMRRRIVWESRLRKRVADASRVLEAHCGIRLRVVAVDTWDSDDDQNDFFQSLSEFEREVSPKPGRLAIGFSSQYRIARGRVHLGGTRGPLHSHILLKERSPNVRETERLELLVHELGHYLGASHSPEPDSVMRPVINGGLQRRLGAHIRFDPVNTLLIAMMGDEIRHRHVRKLADLSLSTKRRMRQIQAVLAKALPDDPAAAHFVQLLGAATTGPLLEATGKILQQLVRVAKLRRQESIGGKRQADRERVAGIAAAVHKPGKPGAKARIKQGGGDQRTEFYVRQAALAARQVRREYAESAFLLALGIAMDDTGILRKLPWTEPIVRQLESARQRRQRIEVLTDPTMRGRRDLTRHFFVSALSVVIHGNRATRGAGIAKELFDAQGGSGFSFVDMAANRAGIAFAMAVLGKRLSLAEVAADFRVEAFLPPLDGLTEGLTMGQLMRDYGGFGDSRFAAELTRIDQRVLALPVYQRLRRGSQKAGDRRTQPH